MKRWILSLLAIIILGLCVWLYIYYSQIYIQNKSSVSNFYAVFLTNGQVYFGHIVQKDSQVLTLSDVFYLKANPKLQSSSQLNDQAQGNVNLSLIKLGKEIHGPTDTMYIVIPQILFWEQLQSNSKIVQAINQYPK